MLFNSISFLVYFLPIVFLIYNFLRLKLLSKNYNKIFLILSSLIFYSLYEIIFLPLIISSILFNYILGNLIINKQNKKFYLFLGIILNVIILFCLKYANFFIDLFNVVGKYDLNYLNLIFPLALSFYTLQQIGFLVDCYENKKLKFNIIDYAFFVTFFPQLVAGPILYFNDIKKQLGNRFSKFSLTNICLAIFLISLGLFKKTIISDFFAKYSDTGNINSEDLNILDAWISSLSFTNQIYFDFSGYSDIAIGISLLFGIKIINNFNSPYKSESIIEFWDRWHISLSNFIKAYMFAPALKYIKRLNEIKLSVVTFLIMVLIGFWHGPSLNFIIFGALHGLAIIINRQFRKLNFNFSKKFNIFLTFMFINMAFVFFRAPDFSVARNIVISMFNFNNLSLLTIYGEKNFLLFFVFTPIIFYFLFFKRNSKELSSNFVANKKKLILTLLMFISSMYSILKSYGVENKFIYFMF